MDQDQPKNLHRRDLIKMMGLGGVIFAPFILTPSRAASKRIVICDNGGAITQAYKEVCYRPFTQATGIEIVATSAKPSPLADIQTMVESKRYLWDMASLNNRDILLLTAGNVYLEKHRLESDPIISLIPRQFASPYGVGKNVSTTVLVYRADAFKGRQAPTSWRDLWDVNHFPGRRALRKHPFDTIEIALMANGVPPNEVYSCPLDRAFRSLDKIKSHIDIWWTTGPQTEQLLRLNEVDLIPMWDVRAQSTINAGASVQFSWDQHLYGCISWAILKGTPHADMCRQFIRFASDPKQQALLARYWVSPTQPNAFNYIDSKYAKRLPSYPDNLKKGLFIDAAYWAKHQQAAIERFNKWMLA